MKRALIIGALVAAASTVAAAVAGQDLELPGDWTSEAIADKPEVQLHYSPDLRCRVAVVSAAAKEVASEALWQALRDAAGGQQMTIEPGEEEPIGFARGEFVGSIRLRQVAGETSTWQLQACFYRKRNQHVCKPICEKLLG